MPRINKKQKLKRQSGSQGGRPKKLCDISESPMGEYSTLDSGQISAIPPRSQQNQHLISSHFNNSQSISNSLIQPSGTEGNAGTNTQKGPSRTTLWRRRQREQERVRGQEERNEGNRVEDWEDTDHQVEEKWPMVTKEIRTTVLKQGMIVFKNKNVLKH